MIKSITIEINGAEIEMPMDEARRIYAELGSLFDKPLTPSIPWAPNTDKTIPYPEQYPPFPEIWCRTGAKFDAAADFTPESKEPRNWDNRSMPEWEQRKIWERTPVTPFYAPK